MKRREFITLARRCGGGVAARGGARSSRIGCGASAYSSPWLPMIPVSDN